MSKKYFPLIIGTAFLLLFSLVAWSMHLRTQEELLWGYRPLFLFLSFWGTLMAFGFSFFSKLPNKTHLLGLSSLSGLILAVGFPDIIPVPFLMFVGFIPLLLVEDSIRKQQPKRMGWELTKYAYHTFIVWNIITSYWVGNAAIGGGIFAIWVNAALMCIPFTLFHYTKRVTPRLGYASLVAYWFAFEYCHLNWDLTWPWLTLGNSFAEYPSWIQWYEYTGVFGGGLWIWLANIWGYKLYQEYKTTKKVNRALAFRITGLLIVPIVISLIMYYTHEEKGEAVDIVVVQPNYEPHYVKFTIKQSEQVQHFMDLSKQKIDQNTDYILYPESSFGYVETHRLKSYPAIRRLNNFLKDYPKAKLVSGFNAFYDFEEGEEHSEAVREREGRDGQPIYFEVLNIALQLNAQTDSIPVYRKSKLVPGPEIFPFRDILFFVEPLVEQLDGTSAGIGSQKNRAVFESSSGKVAPTICYESVFGDYYREYMLRGGELGFIMTNDGWWDHTAGHRQHLLFGALRAIETRRSIARSANTGISCFINQRGDVLQATEYGEEAVIKASLQKNNEMTFYMQWGDAIARVCVFLSLIFLFNTFVKSRMQKEEES